MPELPEVETIKRQLEKTLKGKKIVDVIINNAKVIKEPSAVNFKKYIKAVKITKVLRKGKALVFELSNGKSLVVHLRMTGQLVYPGDAHKSRVSFKLSNGKLLDYNDRRLLGELKLIDDWRELRFIKELGPEPFDLTAKEFSRKFIEKKTKIKPLLLDQKFICGIGNLYAAEALFKARVSPFKQACNLSEKEKSRLFAAIKEILKKAIKHKGSSMDQYVTADGTKGNFVRFHKVYDKAGEGCSICRHPIKRVSQAGRGTYYCERCQK